MNGADNASEEVNNGANAATNVLQLSPITTSNQRTHKSLTDQCGIRKKRLIKNLVPNSTAAQEREAKRRIDEVNRKMARSEACKDLVAEIAKELLVSDVGQKAKELILALGCPIGIWDTSVSCIRFRRRITAEYDPQADQFVPVSPRICLETTGIAFTLANDMLRFKNAEDLDAHIGELFKSFPARATIIYIVQGAAAAVKRWQNEQNRYMRELVLGDMQDLGPSSSQRSEANESSPKRILQWLTGLEIHHNLKVVHTSNAEETATWISNITQDVGMLHWAARRAHEVGLVDVGRVPSGVDAKDVTSKSLSMIKYVTPQVSTGIATVHENMWQLITRLKQRGPNTLDSLYRPGVSGRKLVGSSLAASIHAILQTQDPNQLVDG
jgi:hypothetical protein